VNAELRLTAAAREELVEHTRNAFPAEAVGLVGGDRFGRGTQILPLPNIAPAGAFLAEPRAQFAAERRLRDEGLALVAIYHSHPEGTPTLSPSDIAFAAMRPTPQIVVAVGSAGAVELRAYRCDDGVRPVALRVLPF
jgi:proteasome lid subunit RPN8/RPN11